ncbi:50S ribosomal protein L3 [Candidatus Curtissbacteria bacterium RBG_13_40_7]|uniref:50S ribosomal protein L3 n=1 Tax=Candidatus Curtissbacteria bacterium RBG_13_40_7 TaxID=1797706 RepID=A0A1F5FVP5_9BACT|nr:MAG: 50S ribosomal protein L3 [Candidatus Curtissbacteria bacterium RBG_13_40_7]
MIATMLGLKKEMTAKFDQHGRRMPVTLIAAEPNIVLTIGGNKVQLGFGQKKRAKKPQSAFVNVAGFAPRFVKEVNKVESEQKYAAGDKLTVSIFQPGDLVKVSGITKGKGFAGGVKRWGFAGGPKTHGQSDRHRAPGSIGQTTTPGRVFKGKKMAGHMGASKHTVMGLEVIEVDSQNNIICVKGSVPGAKNGLVVVQKTGEVKKSQIQEEKPKEEAQEQKKTVAEVAKESEESRKQEVNEEKSQTEKEKGEKEDAKK